MNYLKDFFKLIGIFICFAFILLSPVNFVSSADSIIWQEVASTSSGKQFIDIGSIQYDSKGVLSLSTKYNEINEENDEILTTNLYLMEVNCEERLYRDASINGIIQKNSTWKEPNGDKLIKRTIIKACTF